MRPPPVTLADSSGAAADPDAPLSGAEVRALLVARWQANHDLRLVQIRGRLYLQVMWNHLEQQSFPLSVEDYADHIERVAAALNDLGLAATVRQWLGSTRDRPRLGKALSLPLEPIVGAGCFWHVLRHGFSSLRPFAPGHRAALWHRPFCRKRAHLAARGHGRPGAPGLIAWLALGLNPGRPAFSIPQRGSLDAGRRPAIP
jgi:hypothetical protein